MYTTYGPCCRLCHALLTAVGLIDSLAGCHKNDFYTEGEPPPHWMRSTR